VTLLDTALNHFAVTDAPGAFHDTADDADALVWRPADPGDNASPSGASAIAGALLLGSALAVRTARATTRGGRARGRPRRPARRPRSRFRRPLADVAEALATGPLQVAIVGESADLVSAAIAAAPGGSVILAGAPDAPGVPLLADRPLVDGNPAAYVCRGYVCDRPVTTSAELTTALSAHRCVRHAQQTGPTLQQRRTSARSEQAC